MGSDFEATIRDGGERAAIWKEVFGSETVKLKSPFPVMVSLPDLGTRTAYEMDIALLTADQRARLVAHLAQRFGYTTEFVEENLDMVGCPILAEDVTLTVRNPQRWFDVAGDDYGDGTGDGDLDWDEAADPEF